MPPVSSFGSILEQIPCPVNVCAAKNDVSGWIRRLWETYKEGWRIGLNHNGIGKFIVNVISAVLDGHGAVILLP